MAFGINVAGGTNAGWRRVGEKPKAWSCCGKQLAGYLARCPGCGTRRVHVQTKVHDALAQSFYSDDPALD